MSSARQSTIDEATGTALEVAQIESVRYVADTSVYDEGLIDGRLIGRYWSPAPTIKPEKDVSRDLRHLAPYLESSFELELDGQSMAGNWKWVGASIDRADERAIVTVSLSHAVRPVELRVKTAMDGTPFMERWLEITNTGEAPIAMSTVAPFAGILWHVIAPGEVVDPDTAPFRVGSFKSDGWGREGEFAWTDLPIGGLELAGLRGHSGWGRPTVFIENRVTGEFAVFDLEWSGNWRISIRHRRVEGSDQFEPPRESLVYLAGGPSAPAPQRIIEAGETVRTPVAHVANLRGGLDDAVQALHTHVRRSVLPAQPDGRNQRIESNHYGFVTDKISPEFLKSDIDVAVSLGCEMYVLDAGWFGRDYGHWWASVGDWSPGPWLPGGVEEIRDYARERGLLFGLWIEPECVGNLSETFKTHPEWVLTKDGQPVVEERPPDAAHYALDLTQSHVSAWVEEQIVGIIERYDLDLVKIDHNMDFWRGGDTFRDGFVENTLWRHYEALHGILDRLRARFPRVILENCAGGGGRTDLGMMRRSHTTLLSDWVRLPRGLLILNGMSLVLPPEVCNRIAGWLSSSDERFGDIDTQLRVAILGHPTLFGVAPSTDEVPPLHRKRIEHAIGLYKSRIRPMLATSRVFHHTPEFEFERPFGYLALEYAAPDGLSGVAGVFRLAKAKDSFTFTPRGLDRGRRYRVTLDNNGQSYLADGASLADQGITVRVSGPLGSELILFDVED